MATPDLNTVAGCRAAIASGQISAAELAGDRLRRIETDDCTPFARVQADQAMEQATEQASRGAASSAGPLAGVPLAHKDMYDRAGQMTGFGAKSGLGRMATHTAPVLARLDAAGQVDLGRLRMSEYALGPTGHNAHHGMPLNPSAPGAITGGSSSGSGAAVAAGLVVGALGSDTGGSIRLPAACCGVVGFKPTQGRVPLSHAMPLSPTQDCIGPLVNTVADAALILRLISGAHPEDASCRDAPWEPESGSKALSDLTIGFDDGGFLTGLAPAAATALSEAQRCLTGQGVQVKEVGLGFFDDLAQPASVIVNCEAATIHAERLRTLPDSYGAQVRARLVQAAAVPATAYLRARQIRAEAIRKLYDEVFGTVDLLILPTLPGPPPRDAENDVADRDNFNRVINGMTRLTRPASILGLPALSLPVLRTEAGPVSLQVIGRHWDEAGVTRLAQLLETHFDPGHACASRDRTLTPT